MLVAQYSVCSREYAPQKPFVSWEDSSIRKWLNSSFYDDTFTNIEKKAILVTDVDNSTSQATGAKDTTNKWKAKGGNKTQDRIYLLSYIEAKKYFPDLKCTESAGGESKKWWTRCSGSPKSFSGTLALAVDERCVGRSNGSTAYGQWADQKFLIRPALWVDLYSDYFWDVNE